MPVWRGDVLTFIYAKTDSSPLDYIHNHRGTVRSQAYAFTPPGRCLFVLELGRLKHVCVVCALRDVVVICFKYVRSVCTGTRMFLPHKSSRLLLVSHDSRPRALHNLKELTSSQVTSTPSSMNTDASSVRASPLVKGAKSAQSETLTLRPVAKLDEDPPAARATAAAKAWRRVRWNTMIGICWNQ